MAEGVPASIPASVVNACWQHGSRASQCNSSSEFNHYRIRSQKAHHPSSASCASTRSETLTFRVPHPLRGRHIALSRYPCIHSSIHHSQSHNPADFARAILSQPSAARYPSIQRAIAATSAAHRGLAQADAMDMGDGSQPGTDARTVSVCPRSSPVVQRVATACERDPGEREMKGK